MKPSDESFGIKSTSDLNLEFPVDDFRSTPPTIPIDELVKQCEEIWKDPSWRFPSEEERLAQKVNVEFVL